MLLSFLALLFLAEKTQANSITDIAPNAASRSPWYIQYQFGTASDTDFGPSLLFILDQSRERSKLHSLSVGRRLASSFYGRDIEVTAHLGLQYFNEQNIQDDIVGSTAFWRLSKRYTFPFTNVPIKISIAQGLSYVDEIPPAEVRDFDPANSAKLTHYLEYSLHYSFRNRLSRSASSHARIFEDISIGYTIFHRSSVFGLFAETAGGINYPGIAIEFVFK